MVHEQIQLIKKEIARLKEQAISSSQKKTRPKPKLKIMTAYPASYIRGERELLEARKKLMEPHKTAIRKENEDNFIHPTKRALELTEKGLRRIYLGDCDQGINCLQEAYQLFRYPKKKYREYFDTPLYRMDHHDLYFNVAKACLEAGEMEDGLLILTHYLMTETNDDYTRNLLCQEFQWDEHDLSGRLGDLVFEYNRDTNQVMYQLPEDLLSVYIDIPYKIPIDLETESKSKVLTNLTLDDYRYLTLWSWREQKDTFTYEIKLPKYAFSSFVPYFIPTLKKLNILYHETKCFETIFLQLHLEGKKPKPIYHNPKDFYDASLEVISFATVEVPIELNEIFLFEFKCFVEHHLSKNKTDEEYIQELEEKVEKEKKLLAEEAKTIGEEELEVEFNQAMEQAEYYGDLKVLLHYFEQHEDHPYEREHVELKDKSIEEYLDFYGDYFNKFRNKNYREARQSKCTFELIEKIKDISLKNRVKEEWKDIQEMIDEDPKQASIIMYRALNYFMEHEAMKRGIASQETGLTISSHYQKLKDFIPISFHSAIQAIKEAGDFALYGDVLEKYSFVKSGIQEQMAKKAYDQWIPFIECYVKEENFQA